jgi:hypothetical protein
VREDRGNRWVIVVFGLIGLLDAYLPAYTDRKEFSNLDGEDTPKIALADTECRAFSIWRLSARAMRV